MITKFDAALIQFFEKIAHAFQRLTGKNNFWLGWAMFWIDVVYVLVGRYIGRTKDNSEIIFMEMSFYVVVYIIIQILITRILQNLTFISNSRVRSRNPLEWLLIGKLLRMICWFSFLKSLMSNCFGSGSWVNTGDDFCNLVMWYFFSCTPLPPGENKLSRLFDSMRSLFTRRHAAVGA